MAVMILDPRHVWQTLPVVLDTGQILDSKWENFKLAGRIYIYIYTHVYVVYLRQFAFWGPETEERYPKQHVP